ncbi:T9SS type A sorting domain-containing protein [Aquimarina sediminis]|uniref:T9SS type A sorting domain-containing protein n=1 Tax=Aquimarina sediminis TaxID=2070536 RepID=UPI000CA08BA9|nr:T9SS type A sorting domain-containing protein [Aquimarina sediminis]
MKKKVLCFLLFCAIFLISSITFSQNANKILFRSTLSRLSGLQSKTISENNKKYTVIQSVGQSSIIGTFSKNKIIVRQGFLQPLTAIEYHLKTNKLKYCVYPNPFIRNLNIVFKEEIKTNILVKIFDLSGKLHFVKTYNARGSIDLLLDLPSSVYVVIVTANNKRSDNLILKK